MPYGHGNSAKVQGSLLREWVNECVGYGSIAMGIGVQIAHPRCMNVTSSGKDCRNNSLATSRIGEGGRVQRRTPFNEWVDASCSINTKLGIAI